MSTYIEFKNVNVCSICLQDLNQDIDILFCKHIFHKSCISQWEDINNKCPICRDTIMREKIVNDDHNCIDKNKYILLYLLILCACSIMVLLTILFINDFIDYKYFTYNLVVTFMLSTNILIVLLLNYFI